MRPYGSSVCALNYKWRPRFAVPAEAGAAEKLRVFLEKLFQLNFGPVGWLSFDTTLVCVCMRGWVGGWVGGCNLLLANNLLRTQRRACGLALRLSFDTPRSCVLARACVRACVICYL